MRLLSLAGDDYTDMLGLMEEICGKKEAAEKAAKMKRSKKPPHIHTTCHLGPHRNQHQKHSKHHRKKKSDDPRERTPTSKQSKDELKEVRMFGNSREDMNSDKVGTIGVRGTRGAQM
ncbi:hypothetical protein AB6A40_009370 [Gnathostoma spinigerum]|uniref:Uncharacterized protein n=1 Tax=Gnathostoma spinigerum TaxID=75299 RepID=A0ABD6EYW8_9BILA